VAPEVPKQPEALTVPKDKWERLMELAVTRGGTAEQFAMLTEAMIRARREDARIQFESALGQFKSDLPAIFKNKKVSFPNKDGSKTEYSHPELEVASEIVAESLKKYGLTHNWKPSEGAN